MLHMIRIGATQVYHDPLAAGINDVQELSNFCIFLSVLLINIEDTSKSTQLRELAVELTPREYLA